METKISAEVRSYGVAVDGAVLTWEQLQAALMALVAATSAYGEPDAGKVAGTKTEFSRFAKEHLHSTANMMMALKYDNR